MSKGKTILSNKISDYLKGRMGSPSGKFTSTWSCSCGGKYNDHQTVIETVFFKDFYY